MKRIQFFINGPIPPKKNNKRIVYNKRLKRNIIVSSERHQDWHEIAMYELLEQLIPRDGIKSCNITYQFYTPTKHRKDSSNLIESINDLLVDYGLLDDDNWFVIHEQKILPVIYEKDGKDGVQITIDVV